MTFKGTQLDIYFHMANHYKKLKTVKSVVDTSAPSGYQELTHRKSRPSSRTERLRTPKSNASNLDEVSVDKYKTSKSKDSNKENFNFENFSRSNSVPPRPPTRRRPSNVPNLKNKFTFRAQNGTAGRVPSNPAKLLPSNHSFGCDSTTDSVFTLLSINTQANPEVGGNNCDSELGLSNRSIPVPVPRQRRSKSSSYKNSISEHEYLQFLLRITEDIIRNDLYTHQDILRVFSSHIEANQGRLQESRMIHQIQILSQELTSDKSSLESHSDSSKQACRCNVSKAESSPNQESCECNSVRCPPLDCNLYQNKNLAMENKENGLYENPIQIYYEELQEIDAESTIADIASAKNIDLDLISQTSSYVNPKAAKARLSVFENKNSDIDAIIPKAVKKVENEEATQTEKPQTPVSIKSTSTTNFTTETQLEFSCNYDKDKIEAANESKGTPCQNVQEVLNPIIFQQTNFDVQSTIINNRSDKCVQMETPNVKFLNSDSNEQEFVLISGPIYVPKESFVHTNPNSNLNASLISSQELKIQDQRLTESQVDSVSAVSTDVVEVLKFSNDLSEVSGMGKTKSIDTTSPSRSTKSSESSRSIRRPKKVKKKADVEFIDISNSVIELKQPNVEASEASSMTCSSQLQPLALNSLHPKNTLISFAGLKPNITESLFLNQHLTDMLEMRPLVAQNFRLSESNSHALNKINEYDLTPQRDNNCLCKTKKHKSKPTLDNARLLLGDEYEIKSTFPLPGYSDGGVILTDAIKQFYPDAATQTESTDWLLTSKVLKLQDTSPKEEPSEKYEKYTYKDKQEQAAEDSDSKETASLVSQDETMPFTWQRKSSLARSKFMVSSADTIEKLVKKVQVDNGAIVDDNKPFQKKVTVEDATKDITIEASNAKNEGEESSIDLTIQKVKNNLDEFRKSLNKRTSNNDISDSTIVINASGNSATAVDGKIGKVQELKFSNEHHNMPYIQVQGLESSPSSESTHITCCGLKSTKKKEKRRDLPDANNLYMNVHTIPDDQLYETETEQTHSLTKKTFDNRRKSLRFEYKMNKLSHSEDTDSQTDKSNHLKNSTVSVASSTSKGSKRPSLVELLPPAAEDSNDSIYILGDEEK